MAGEAGRIRKGVKVSVTAVHAGVLAYFGWKSGWPPLYACIADMPVEVADTFFMCLAWDQAQETQERMNQMARQKQSELLQQLHGK